MKIAAKGVRLIINYQFVKSLNYARTFWRFGCVPYNSVRIKTAKDIHTIRNLITWREARM